MKNNDKFISRDDLISLGFKKTVATAYIHQAREILVSRGFTAYDRNRLMIVPKTIINEILAVEL
ncbi:DUF3173 domain-containing protein [Lactococcus raffinolactis]|jgi:hypothetical protein|uniref:DUF3173 family protein n=1 Tax=Pseudolactococcus TaxID=3436058 RepID=UPI001C6FEAC5|nr:MULTISPECIES: DUF3173 family protein [Lactococcus]MBW9331534.1 DUF3173 domain-containing protein [Lactococcus raffinolactis]MCJ1995959.1 DUF3173 domain-containing protein [Lactococcus carnosus]